MARPGLSAIAGALAVELTMATMSHPLGADAPADPAADGVAGPLGHPLHMLRGQLTGFSQVGMLGAGAGGLVPTRDCHGPWKSAAHGAVLGMRPHAALPTLIPPRAQMAMRGGASNLCTACSPAVLEAFKQGGTPFILEVRAPR